MVDAETIVANLAPRRACLEGAKETLELIDRTLHQADSLELAHMFLEGPIATRLELLELALRQFDAALAGEEVPDA